MTRITLAIAALLFVTGCRSASAGGGAPKGPARMKSKDEPAIVQIGDPVLRERAADVPPEKLGTPELKALVARMIATMRAAPGVGLAASQIGVPLRVIVLEDREELLSYLTEVERKERERAPFPVRAIVNPVLREIEGERAAFFEGCLSVRGYVGLVERALEVEVTGVDVDGAPLTWRVRGWPARILQHEVDHVNGTVYIDRVVTRSFSSADEAKKRFAGKPIAEVKRLIGL